VSSLANITITDAKKEKWEAVVVGAGPAGASAAYFLSKLGYKVLLIEAAKLPRPKACGDGIGPRAVAFLERLGLKNWLEENNFYRIEHLRLVSASGAELISTPQTSNYEISYGYVIPRSVIDLKLVKQAIAAGSYYLEGYRVTDVLKEGQQISGVLLNNGQPLVIKSQLTVVADGSSGKVSRLFGAKVGQVQAVGYRGYALNLPDQKRTASIIFTSQFPAGYAWIFPTNATKANIGLGTLGLSKDRSSQGLKTAFNSTFKRLLNKEAVIENERLGATMRMNFAQRPAWFQGVAFVGDACGLVSPINGEGISHALESGELLAEAFAAKPKNSYELNKSLATYEKLLQQKFNGYFKLGRLLVKLLAQPKRLDKLILKAQNDAELKFLFIGIMANTVHPRHLLKLKPLLKVLF